MCTQIMIDNLIYIYSNILDGWTTKWYMYILYLCDTFITFCIFILYVIQTTTVFNLHLKCSWIKHIFLQHFKHIIRRPVLDAGLKSTDLCDGVYHSSSIRSYRLLSFGYGLQFISLIWHHHIIVCLFSSLRNVEYLAKPTYIEREVALHIWLCDLSCRKALLL